MSTGFDDLISANAGYADAFTTTGLEGAAAAGIGVVTCMDSRIDPLAMLGLSLGDAKVVRNPGAQVTPDALEAMVLGVHLLGIRRILVVAHTRCAMTTRSEDKVRELISGSAGQDAAWQPFHVVADQQVRLAQDVAKLRSHPLIGERAETGGFVYDVDSGRLSQHC